MSEIEALATVDAALASLPDDEARHRVLSWAVAKYGIGGGLRGPLPGTVAYREPHAMTRDPAPRSSTVNQQATLWLKRNGIPLDDRLALIVSIDQQDIDVVVAELPEPTTKARMRSVFLLRGVAAYMATGEWRFEDSLIRTTCRHYNAYDPSNFSVYLRSFSDEIGGNREAGYSLTAKGQKSAAELLRTLLSQTAVVDNVGNGPDAVW